jgi:hypothetical protein
VRNAHPVGPTAYSVVEVEELVVVVVVVAGGGGGAEYVVLELVVWLCEPSGLMIFWVWVTLVVPSGGATIAGATGTGVCIIVVVVCAMAAPAIIASAAAPPSNNLFI